ncbi:MAG: sigma-54-dependent Fis family transcriptional regulator [Myxococcales bacterium]|nr:sigma-54-dependent Fis family transcriptional regulator [Myxococcales bacterium]
MSLRILVIDDEKSFGDMVTTLLRKEGYTVEYVTSAEEGLKKLMDGGVAITLCDVQMPGMSGLDFLREAKALNVLGTTIVMSAYGNIDTALNAMKLGAYDYISKPFNRDEIILTLRKAEERERLKRENTALKEEQEKKYSFERMVASSDAMMTLFRTIRKIAPYKSTVLLMGESGTGKELTARAIHTHSSRSKQPFVAVNCGAIPENLLESELFGYVRGAFTDAYQNKKGLFEEAHTGTLFLDEIGELPLGIQVKLLRALQEDEVRRVGDTKSTRVDVRVIAATVRDLAVEVQRNAFREDLYYRLNVLPIRIPPLRSRPEDIPLLVDHFIVQTNKRLGTNIRSVHRDAMKALIDYDWPGNVRELENTIERALVLADSDVITLDMLPERLTEPKGRKEVPYGSFGLSIKKSQRHMEETLIRRALIQTEGNRTAAARLLELSHRALLYKIKDYEINDL